MIQWLLKLTFESRKSTAMSGSILIMSLMSWMWPAHVAKVYTKSWADLLLLFITKEWTKMAVSCEAQTYKKKYFCCRNSNGTTMWSPQINLFAQFPNFQSNLHLQLKFPLNDTPYSLLCTDRLKTWHMLLTMAGLRSSTSLFPPGLNEELKIHPWPKGNIF